MMHRHFTAYQIAIWEPLRKLTSLWTELHTFHYLCYVVNCVLFASILHNYVR